MFQSARKKADIQVLYFQNDVESQHRFRITKRKTGHCMALEVTLSVNHKKVSGSKQ